MTTTGNDHPSQDTARALTATEQAREQAAKDKIDAVLAATLVPESLATIARFGLPTPLDLPFDLPDDNRYRLLAVEVVATRALGLRPSDPETQPGEPPHLEVRGLVRDLKTDSTPYANRYEHWVWLPTELAEPLLGRAHVS